jgi:hypothetical protein
MRVPADDEDARILIGRKIDRKKILPEDLARLVAVPSVEHHALIDRSGIALAVFGNVFDQRIHVRVIHQWKRGRQRVTLVFRHSDALMLYPMRDLRGMGRARFL